MKALDALVNQAPQLHSLMDRVRRSQACLKAIDRLLPPSLKNQIRAGAFGDGEWCLLVASPAVSAKLRQLEPRFLSQLEQQGFEVNRIRIKVEPCK